MEAMLTPWVSMLRYAYSPFTLMGQVLSYLRVSKWARLFLIAPFWAPTCLVSPICFVGRGNAAGGCHSVMIFCPGRSTQGGSKVWWL